MTAKRLPTLFGDLPTVQGMISEYVALHGQLVLYEQLDTRFSELLDDLHGETLSSGKRYLPKVPFLTLLELQPEQALLTRWGIDAERDIVLYPAVATLVEVGLADWPEGDVARRPTFKLSVGDRFTWDDARYEVLEVQHHKYWGNTNRPLYLRVVAKRYRENTLEVDCTDIGTAGGPAVGGQGSVVGDLDN